ncbi:extracellular solute-binding protein family 3 [Methylobacterium sp. 4-46]|uniref:substrate-binding domain-containing protein n=1 Tax=unclassified Methylobacterium TaxID=2615210 RepID=UPI000165C64C|nr:MULTISPECIES: substrate-binding domain-containing protein [Methylobacterium]ACA17405.1 extracellular solute-binding protein family 3 [Methylobacterium sp. 4-46]WFT83091.1 substrate-binding domain-containing protein [Methylobacterium nodulans]
MPHRPRRTGIRFVGRCSGLLRLACGCAAALACSGACARELRVCADPNNLPFSNRGGEGFENRIVDIVARDLGATVTYTWWAQRRGFLRNTILAGRCDLVPGIPVGLEALRPTRPYYRSSFVVVSRPGGPSIRSLDDPNLAGMTVGVQLVGKDAAGTPPARALARRGMTGNVRGYLLTGDYAAPNPPARIIDAVASGEIDVALAWGPMAGYFAARADPPLRVAPIEPAIDGPKGPMVFDVAMGVRRGDEDLRLEVGAALERHRAEIDAILLRYDVPRLDGTRRVEAGP